MAKKSIENTEQRRDQDGRFLLGNIGGPGGPKGRRNKLAQQYIDDFYDVWQRKGMAALERVAENDPGKFIKAAAALIPQHFKVEQEHALTLSVPELEAKLLQIKTELLDSDVDPDLLGPPPEGNVDRQ